MVSNTFFCFRRSKSMLARILYYVVLICSCCTSFSPFLYIGTIILSFHSIGIAHSSLIDNMRLCRCVCNASPQFLIHSDKIISFPEHLLFLRLFMAFNTCSYEGSCMSSSAEWYIEGLWPLFLLMFRNASKYRFNSLSTSFLSLIIDHYFPSKMEFFFILINCW